MVTELITALYQEPWCFHPSQVADLTDHQIIEHYLKPAAERSRRAREEAEGRTPLGSRPARSEPDPEPGTPEHRRQIVGAFVHMGMRPEKAAERYEQQLAAWRAQEGK